METDLFQQPVQLLRHLFDVAVARALPQHNLAQYLPPVPPNGRTVVIGAGKAAASMAQALEAAWPIAAPLSGVVVTRYGHIPSRPASVHHQPTRIEVLTAAHPILDAAGVQAAQRILASCQGLSANDLVICLISGGGSALLTLPREGLSLHDKQAINRQLLASGANIAQINCVRKHLSQIKGGQLAQACAPAQLVTLAISDVPGDEPAIIASGPTLTDATSCADALAILQRYAIDIPPLVQDALLQGRWETPKPDSALAQQPFHLIATPLQSLQAAAEAARALGLNAYILSDAIEGEAYDAGLFHAALARASAQGLGAFIRPCVILSGGETTVTLKPAVAGSAAGRGGRAGEFCLGVAQGLQAQAQVFALAADTDGIDGSEHNAGAYVTPDTLQRSAHLHLRLADFRQRNDAFGFFAALDDLVVSGPTYTNVNDFRAILIR